MIYTDFQNVLMCFVILNKESFGFGSVGSNGGRNAVISSNAGGIPEVNIQGETGFLTEVGDVETMAKDHQSLARRCFASKNERKAKK